MKESGDKMKVVNITSEDPKDVEIAYLQGKIKKLEGDLVHLQVVNRVLSERHGITDKPEPYVMGYLLGISGGNILGRKGRK